MPAPPTEAELGLEQAISPFGLSVFLFGQTAKPRPVRLFKDRRLPGLIFTQEIGAYASARQAFRPARR
jgi:hypothetical protein